MKKLNKIRFEKIYVDNKLKRFRERKNKNASTELMTIQKMTDAIDENFKEMKKTINVVNEKFIKIENN